ncbi:class I SAM-dependent methyltransferase [Actinophytocola sediminis]
MTRPPDWSGVDGTYWADHDERYDTVLAPLTRHLLAAADIQPTDRILDVGCGCGNTTRQAGRAAPRGGVLGVDLSPPMLAKARQRTEEAGVPNVSYQLANAQTHEFDPVDVVISQLGVMFFDDPVAAFTNLRRTGGRLVFVCWQALELNENRVLKAAAMSPHVDVPTLSPGTGAASLADPARIDKILTAAGYTDITVTSLNEPLLIGRTVAEALDMELSQPTTAEALANAGPTATQQATEHLRAAYTARATPTGVHLNSATWLTTATAT